MSKLYYVAQVLPLPNKYRKQIDSSLSRFIFRGRHERLQLDELQNSYEQGGLGLPNIAVKADSLLLKQMCRMMNLPDEKSFRLLGYWLGEFLRDTGLGENFPELADLGPVSHIMSGRFPLHQYMLDTFLEAVGRGEITRANGPELATIVRRDEILRAGRQAAQLAGRGDAWDQQQNAAHGEDGEQNREDTQGQRGDIRDSNMKVITTKAIYLSRMKDLLVPPKVEIKFPQVNFQELVYPRILNKVLEVKQRDLFFSLTHGIYRNRERLFQQNRADDPHCQNPACKRENLIHDIEHIFCSCYKVRAAWNWTRRKFLNFLTDRGRPPDVNNTDILLARYPKGKQEDECLLLLGTYVELVDRDVVLKQKELMVNTLFSNPKI